MGSIAKVFKKAVKAVTKPVSKAFKGVAKGILKVGKATMRGIAKLNQKLGPLGSIALAVAMPYALSGLSTGTTALMNSQNAFLRSIGTVGNSIRTGYQAFNTGISKTFNTITKSISQSFQKFAPKSISNIYSRISQGAKNLFTSARDTVKKYTPKFRTAKAGTVEVYGVGDPGVSVISSTDAAAAIQKGTLQASELGKQTLTQPSGWFTKTNTVGVQADNIVSETINNAYKARLDGFGKNAMQMFNDVKTKSINLGTYVNDEQIGSYIENNLATTQVSVPEMTYLGDMDYYGTATGKYNIKTDIKDLGLTGDYVDNGQGGFRFTGDKTFSNEPVKNASSDLMKAAKKTAFKFGEGLLKPSDEKIKPYIIPPTQDMTMQTSIAGYSGTDITGTSGGSLFAQVYGQEAANKLSTYYKNMNLLGQV